MAETLSLSERVRVAVGALELAEDVLSRSPFSTRIWPNGMHPNGGIERIRQALALLKEGMGADSAADGGRSGASAPSGWRPIETWTEEDGNCLIVSSGIVTEGLKDGRGWYVITGRNGSRVENPTHWMPLPLPPNTGATRAEGEPHEAADVLEEKP